MAEMTFATLKTSHQIREYEEKKTQEKKRNLMYLIAQYLRDEGYFETLSTFGNEAQLLNSYQICDNIDLPQVLQDFESYYFVRFQKYPKICKKANPEEGVINCVKKVSRVHTKKPGIRRQTAGLYTAIRNALFKLWHFLDLYPKLFIQPPAAFRLGFTSSIFYVINNTNPTTLWGCEGPFKCFLRLDCFLLIHLEEQLVSDTSVTAKPNGKNTTATKSLTNTTEKKTFEESNCLSVVPLGSENNANNAPAKPEKRLKPLGGLGIHNAEWLSLAEMITKDIVLQDLNIRWSDIMGLEEPKRLLKEAVVYPIKYPELFRGILTPWKGLLLFGPPGTGKTLLAKAVATECKTTFFNITASSIVSKWRGDSEKLVRVMFDLARYHAPSTIFLDELDALASRRDGSHHSSEHEASRRLKTELLIQLDGLSQTEDQVFFLATSNLPWELDPAMLRRLEKRILVDIPNSAAREAMFKHYLPEVVLKQPLLKCDIYYEFLAKETEGYSGSDIKLVCKETAMQAVRKIFQVLDNLRDNEAGPKLELQTIKTSDVQIALDKTKPSASHLIDKYKTWQKQFGSV